MKDTRLISAQEFREAHIGARPPFVLDLREPDGFALGRIPGSVNVPVHDLGRRRRDLPASTIERILLVGDDRHRTLAGARFLDLMGFADIAVLDGGIAAWDRPLERDDPRDPPAPAESSPRGPRASGSS